MQTEMGARIRQLRQSLNLSLQELAEMLNLTTGYIGLVERSERGTSIENIGKLCNIFNVTSDYLLFGKGEQLKFEDTCYDEYFKEAFTEKEKELAINVAKKISVLRGSENDLDLLMQALDFQVSFINKIMKNYH